MSEVGKLQLQPIADPAIQFNFDQIARQNIGRGPAQARVYNSANISITTSGTPQALTFNTERWDTGNFHSTSSNTNRLTAPTAGLYTIGGCARFAANATGFRQVYLQVTFAAGGTAIIASIVTPNNGAGAVTDVTINTEYQLAAGDYVELFTVQNSGGALNVTAAANYSPEFWIHRVGSQA